MYRSGGGRSSLSSSSGRPKESGSGSRPARPGASARGRSPRRSRSPSPRGRRHRSPSPRRTGRARSPSGASRSRRGSEQRDGSLSRQLSLGKHPRFAERHSPSRRSESSEEHSLQTLLGNDCYDIDSLDRRRLTDRPVDGDMGRGDFAECPVFSRQLLCPQSLERYSSPERSPPGYFNRKYNKDCHSRDVFCSQLDFNMNYDYLQDIPRETDRDGELLKKHLYSSEEREQEPKCHRHDRDDRLLDVSMDPQGFLAGRQSYRKQSLGRSPSPAYPDEDFRELEKSRSERNMCQDMLSSDAVISGLTNPVQSSEPHFLHTPETAPAMPKKSILKKRVDDPSVQVKNFLTCSNKNAVEDSANKEFQPDPDDWRAFSVLKKNAFPSELNFEICSRQEYQELTSESADFPHEKASQDGNGFSHILEKVADSTSTQVKRRCNSLEVESEEKFLYGDDKDDSSINCSSVEKLTVSGGKEFLSPSGRPPSPIQSVKPDISGGSRIEYEKIQHLLKTIGLDIGVAEIDKGAARTQERLHGKKRTCSLGGHSAVSHKPDSSEKDSMQSNINSSESSEKSSLSPCGSFQPSNDASSVSISEHSESKTLGHNSAGSPEKSFPLVTPSAPPSLPDLPPLPLPASQYSAPYFSAFTAPELLQNYPPPTMPALICDAYGHYRPYSASAWTTYAPGQESNPSFPDVQGLGSVTVPPKCTWSNLRVIETVSLNKVNPKIKRNKSALVEIPITPTDSKLLSQSSEIISDGKNPASEMQNVTEERKKLMSEQAARQKKLVYLNTELKRRSRQQGKMLRNKRKRKGEDPLLREVSRVKQNIVKEIAKLRIESQRAEIKQYEPDKISLSLCINTLEKYSKKASKPRNSFSKEKSENTKTQEKTSNSIKECLNKNPFYENRENLDHQEGVSVTQETQCSLKRKQCGKQKEDRDERSTKLSRKEESEITKELGESGNGNEFCKEREHPRGQKIMIKLVLKKDNLEVKKEVEKEESQIESSWSSSEEHSLSKPEREHLEVKKEVEKKECQTESNQSSSEGCSLSKPERHNQNQDHVVDATNDERAEEGKCRETKSQSGNPDSKQKVNVTEAQNLGMMTKKEKIAKILKVQQRFKSFDSPHCHSLSPLPQGPQAAISTLDKPATAKSSDVKSSHASTKLPPVVKKCNPELVPLPLPNIAKAVEDRTVILKGSQKNVELQEQAETCVQDQARKLAAAEEQAMLKTSKMKQELHIFQKPHPPPLIPEPPPLLSFPLAAPLSLDPTIPPAPPPLFSPAVSRPVNNGHSVCIHHVPCFKTRDKRITGVLPSRSFCSACHGLPPTPLLGREPPFHMAVGRTEEPVLQQGGGLHTQQHGQPRNLHEARNSTLPELLHMPPHLTLPHLRRRPLTLKPS